MYHTEIQNIGNRDLNIVTIGGGTGNSTILKGLKKISKNITTIVTVSDDGGGSGILRRDLGILPPGDIRACLISLANTEPAMENLMNYRFREGSLKGQSFGNLFLAAMTDIYGDFEKAIEETGKVLAITGNVLPITKENIVLFAELEDGTILEGESNIVVQNKILKNRIKKVYIKPESAKPLDMVVSKIMEADIIIVGPGSLYTSIIPNLLVKDIGKVLEETTAKIYYICNIMTQNGETDNYTVYDHIEAITKHIGTKFIDKIVINNKYIPEDLLKIYNSKPVYLSEKDKVLLKDYELLLCECSLNFEDYIRHNAEKISKYIIDDFNNEIIKIYKKTNKV